MKAWIKITFRLILCHLFSYLLVSVSYYNLVMKNYYQGENPVFATFLVTEKNPTEWAIAMTWLFPFQILHALIFVSFLILIWDWFATQSFAKRFLSVFWLKGLIGGIASIGPTPGNLEGFLFFLPSVTTSIHLLVAFEVLLQSAVTSFLFVFLTKNFKADSP
ncbi:hypothetical protein LPTSP3_g35260 [Leptospira kobayashii]|uniref:Uncharacterized protein n=1 Tax=Leptospira kobayashii TaxID=1917830 RepID=A0ABM7UN95_9LEPT|nr:hypothetical protein [Leptospira kobayashii]BDA80596.1 hypothetical protein LPTSP3_g35260 [Leptospira kobayashii]